MIMQLRIATVRLRLAVALRSRRHGAPLTPPTVSSPTSTADRRGARDGPAEGRPHREDRAGRVGGGQGHRGPDLRLPGGGALRRALRPAAGPEEAAAVRDLQGDLRPLPPDGRRRARTRRPGTVTVADRSAALAAVSEALLGHRRRPALRRRARAARRGGPRASAGPATPPSGVPDEEGDGFSRWISAGLTDEEIDAIGPLPRNHGLLGAALHDPGAVPQRRRPHRRPLRRLVARRPPRPRRVPRRARSCSAATSSAPSTSPTRTAASPRTTSASCATSPTTPPCSSSTAASTRPAGSCRCWRSATAWPASCTTRSPSRCSGSASGSRPATPTGARALLDEIFAELRSLILQLRPPALERDGLAASLAKHLEVVGRTHGIATRLDAGSLGDVDAGHRAGAVPHRPGGASPTSCATPTPTHGDGARSSATDGSVVARGRRRRARASTRPTAPICVPPARPRVDARAGRRPRRLARRSSPSPARGTTVRAEVPAG